MTFRDLFRRDPPRADDAASPVDDALEHWVVTATRLMDAMAPSGRLVVALLGEALVDDVGPWWFGHEPSVPALRELLAAVGEDPDPAVELLGAEAPLAVRRAGRPSDATRARWRGVVASAVRAPGLAASLPERNGEHRAAERVWRTAAATQQPWRATRLTPGRALRQLRWWPGCATRTHVGYDDPLGLASAARSVLEHRWSAEEDAGLRPASAVLDTPVDPLGWRLSALRFAADDLGWPEPHPTQRMIT